MPRPRQLLAVAAAVAIAAVAACADDAADAPSDRAPDPTTDSAPSSDVADEARFAEPGPYDTGVTTMELPDGRKVEVYYPAADGSTDGVPKATYLQTDPIPAEMLASLPAPPADVDLDVELPAYRDVPVGDDGPFPLVLFSHGAGGWRGVQGIPLSHIAAWGYVVASIDYAEFGLIAQMTGVASAGEVGPPAVATSVIDLLRAADGDAASPFHDRIDLDHIAGVGHSRGGGTMFGLLDDPDIDTVVGWAPVGPEGPVTSTTPTLVIAGGRDASVTPDEVRATYAALQAPKRLVMIDTMGHNAFTDACLAIRSGTDLTAIAKGMGIGIPDRLVDLGRNGCEGDDLDVEEGWRIIEHFTVAHLRSEFGTDPEPVGLGDGVVEEFGDVTITMEHTP